MATRVSQYPDRRRGACEARRGPSGRTGLCVRRHRSRPVRGPTSLRRVSTGVLAPANGEVNTDFFFLFWSVTKLIVVIRLEDTKRRKCTQREAIDLRADGTEDDVAALQRLRAEVGPEALEFLYLLLRHSDSSPLLVLHLRAAVSDEQIDQIYFFSHTHTDNGEMTCGEVERRLLREEIKGMTFVSPRRGWRRRPSRGPCAPPRSVASSGAWECPRSRRRRRPGPCPRGRRRGSR